MNEIIRVEETIINNEIVPTVNARDLYLNLGSKQHFTDWIKDRIEKYGFEEGQDFCLINLLSKEGRGGHNKIDYILRLDVAKEIAMVEHNEKGKELRRYFIEIEKKYKEVKPMTFEEVMRNALLLADNRIKLLETKIEEDKPITDFGRAISQSIGTVKIGDWIKAITDNGDLKIGRNKAFQWFRDNKYLTQDNKPMQQYVNQGLFELKEGMVVTDTKTIQTFTTLLTGKGQMYFAGKLKNSLDI